MRIYYHLEFEILVFDLWYYGEINPENFDTKPDHWLDYPAQAGPE